MSAKFKMSKPATLDDVLTCLGKVQDSLDELKEQVATCNENIDTCNRNITNCNSVVENALPRIEALEKDMRNVKKEIEFVKEKNVRLESYLKRDNLLFGGLSESEPEICEDKVKFLIRTSLNLPCDDIKFIRVYRVGKKQPGKTRPILASFHFFGDRLKVWQACGQLKDTLYWLAEDFPEEIQKRRRALKPILRKAIETLGKERAFLISDRLTIDGRQYTVKNLSTLPQNLQPQNVATPVIGDLVAFGNEYSPLSNFHEAHFEIDGTKYHHVEQYFTSKKRKSTEMLN